MARRAGKAASRKARQRHQPKTPRPSVPSPDATVVAEETPVPPVGTPHAREAASLTPPRRTSAVAATASGSQLTGRERAEYHYVERDLRNIAILTAIMAAMLVAAWFVFDAMGIVA